MARPPRGFFSPILLLLPLLLPAVSAIGAPLPDPEVAGSGANAARIFNAVHSALRQWGSSLHHNGLSFIPVTVPAGNIFYHGRQGQERPPGLEWLAFEIEHGAAFARSWEPDEDDDGRSSLSSLHGRFSALSPSRHDGVADDNQKPLYQLPSRPPSRGYLHVYRAERPLRLVYVDGQAAAKCGLGTLDSQDYVLLDWRPEDEDKGDGIRREWERADKLCRLAPDWGVDGWVRMEMGFEIIYCNFSAGAGLELVEALGSPLRNESGLEDPDGGAGRGRQIRWSAMDMFEWIRTAATRYGGLQRGRLEVHWSRMVSAFAYAVDTGNPDADRPELPRIVKASREDRRGIRDRLREVVDEGEDDDSIDWQAVVDDIVSRYSGRLRFLAEAVNSSSSPKAVRSELATMLRPFLDFPDDRDSAADASRTPARRCTHYYLGPALDRAASWTPEDRAIYAAVKSVSARICHVLFEMREVMASNTENQGPARVQELAVELRRDLDWTTWKECGGCADPDRVCFVPMFPAGTQEDYTSPRCRRPGDIGMGYFVDPNWGTPNGSRANGADA